jgi:hypothetical protein
MVIVAAPIAAQTGTASATSTTKRITGSVEIPAQFKRLGPELLPHHRAPSLVEQLVAFVDGTPVTKVGEIAQEGLRGGR